MSAAAPVPVRVPSPAPNARAAVLARRLGGVYRPPFVLGFAALFAMPGPLVRAASSDSNPSWSLLPSPPTPNRLDINNCPTEVSGRFCTRTATDNALFVSVRLPSVRSRANHDERREPFQASSIWRSSLLECRRRDPPGPRALLRARADPRSAMPDSRRRPATPPTPTPRQALSFLREAAWRS